MERIICILLALYGVVMLMMCSLHYYTVLKNNGKHKNKVHFYVARDINGELWLYIGKPIREDTMFCSNLDKRIFALSRNFKPFGLNKDDYADLKFEDEPLEVFINMED